MPECRIYLKDTHSGNIFRFDHKTKSKIEFKQIGIIGYVMTQNIELNTENAYNDNRFNEQVDINTTLPLHVRPLRMTDN